MEWIFGFCLRNLSIIFEPEFQSNFTMGTSQAPMANIKTLFHTHFPIDMFVVVILILILEMQPTNDLG